MLARRSLVAARMAAATAVTLVASVAARAQGPGVGGVVVSANHKLLGGPLVGGAAEFRAPVVGSRLSFRVGLEAVTGSSLRTGVACAGLSLPNACQPEPVRDDARLDMATGGGSFQLLRTRSTAVALTADLCLASVHADTRGLASGQEASAGRTLWGGRAGAELTWLASTRVPLALRVESTIGALKPIARQLTYDGYAPFENAFGLGQLRVGLGWRLGGH